MKLYNVYMFSKSKVKMLMNNYLRKSTMTKLKTKIQQ